MKLLNFLDDFKRWFIYYPLYKIIALLLAIVMYLYVNGEFK